MLLSLTQMCNKNTIVKIQLHLLNRNTQKLTNSKNSLLILKLPGFFIMISLKVNIKTKYGDNIQFLYCIFMTHKQIKNCLINQTNCFGTRKTLCYYQFIKDFYPKLDLLKNKTKKNSTCIHILLISNTIASLFITGII